ncbi:unnamed protein product [Clavelina lepadiformis]|uniref:Domain of unknown function with conserved HDNR motif domain-containing protein n=1 Tax=Clavelina lepadiformis TaxID=159417 RepID=A0ABP0FPI8_CLALP
MTATDLVGTWFPSGYYGHHRSKTRNDILQDFRHEATPMPPNQFIKWVRTSPDTHRFSKHDNRHSFPTDASYFDTGLGRRKGAASITAFKPDLMTWFPHKDEIAKEGSSVSMYRLDFRKGGVKSTETLPQRLSPRIRKKMAEMEANDARLKWISDYKRQFSHGQPNPRVDIDLNTGRAYTGVEKNPRSHQYVNMTGKLKKVVPPYLAHTIRRTKSAPPTRFSVGDCLVWNPTPGAPVSINSTAFSRSSITPRPPPERRTSEHLLSPRPVNYRASHTTKDYKNMTPAATEISSFTPIQSKSPPTISEVTMISAPLPDPTQPVVVVQ